jgi:hypothetical protein
LGSGETTTFNCAASNPPLSIDELTATSRRAETVLPAWIEELDRGRLTSQSDATPARKDRLVPSMASIVRLMVHFPSFRDKLACAVLELRIAVQTSSGIIGTWSWSMRNGAQRVEHVMHDGRRGPD